MSSVESILMAMFKIYLDAFILVLFSMDINLILFVCFKLFIFTKQVQNKYFKRNIVFIIQALIDIRDHLNIKRKCSIVWDSNSIYTNKLRF